MQAFRRRIFIGLVSVSLCLVITPYADASDSSTARMIHDALQPEASPLETVNEFIAHSEHISKKPVKKIQVNNGQIFARLLTPLNSSFNLNGDDVQAIVISSLNDKGKPWLEEGTIIEGCVESSKKATFGQTDGALVIRFYKAHLGDKQIDLFAASDTDDGSIKPSSESKPTTKKQRIRGVLMTVSRIAIPASIGTGGIAIAISAGAGAVIGCAFADKGKHIQGTVRGAWEGAGLTILDPLVCKGKSVILPEGTPIQLQLTESVIVPPYTGNPDTSNFSTDLAGNLLGQKNNANTSLTKLETHAQILNQSPISGGTTTSNGQESENHLAMVNKKISQNNLAGALTELTVVEDLYPNDENVKKMHTELYSLVSGGKQLSDTASDTTH
jgi:hypothetical protein